MLIYQHPSFLCDLHIKYNRLFFMKEKEALIDKTFSDYVFFSENKAQVGFYLQLQPSPFMNRPSF